MGPVPGCGRSILGLMPPKSPTCAQIPFLRRV
jgi:hypothetical protein